MYTRDYTVERFNTDRHNRLDIPTLFHYLNDIMERNAESYGMGANYHLKHDLAWVLIEYQIKIHRLPRSDDIINVGTLPYSFKRVYGYRVYEGKSPDGALYFEGKGKFALINIKSKEFLRPTSDMLKRFTDAKKEPVALPFEKWRVNTDELINQYTREVPQSHIDVNMHLNNAYYPAYAYEALPKELLSEYEINHVNVKFKKEVFEGQTLQINVYKSESMVYVTIEQAKEIACEVSFKINKRQAN